jgi:pimeloyl-ACP methyl ester carboxylesterase
MRRVGVLVLGLLAMAALGWQGLHRPPEVRELANGARLDWVECWFEVSFLRPVHCGRLTTAREAGAGTRFRLPVVYVPAPPWARGAARNLYIAGGPGGAAGLDAAGVSDWLAWLDEVGWSGDTLWYDQRGVGLSQPRVDCPELRALRRELLPLDLSQQAAGERLRAAGLACKTRLEATGVDFGRFDTPANARDARDLMATFGDVPWNLYAVSYGTRVALELMREAPERLRSVVLDSVYPPQVHAELADPWLLDRVFSLVSRVCDLLGACNATDEIVATDLQHALARLRREPLVAEVPDPRGRGALEIRLGREDFAWMLFDATYRWDLLPQLPAFAAAAAGGDVTPALRGLISDSVSGLLDESMSEPVAASVDCNDSPYLARAQAEAMRGRFAAVAPLLDGHWEQHFCRFWKVADAGASFRTPVRSQVPALLLAGEFDPVTPPEWAELAVRTLPNGQVFEFPAIGHGVLDSHECAVTLVRGFFDDPQDSPVPACLARLE